MSEITVEGFLRVRLIATGEEVTFGSADFDFEFADVEPRNMGPQYEYVASLYAEPNDEDAEPIEIECELYEYPQGIYDSHSFSIPESVDVVENTITISIMLDRPDDLDLDG